MVKRLARISTLCGLILGIPLSVRAEDGSEPKRTTARYGFSPLVLAGYSDGVAAGLQWDFGVAGLRASAGYMPLLLVLSDSDTGEFDSLELLHSAQFNGDVLFLPIRIEKSSRAGLSVGYRYNTQLHHGLALGGQVEVDLSKSLTVLAMLNFAIYPQGTGLARDELDDPEGLEFNFPFGAGFQGGLGFGLKF